MRMLLFSTSSRAFRAGGMEVVFHALATALRNRGHEVAEVHHEAVSHREQVPKGEVWGVPLDMIRTRRKLPTPASLWKSAASLLRMARCLSAVKPEVVNVHFVNAFSVYLAVLKGGSGYRLVLSTHGSDLLRPANAVDRALLPFLLRRADAVTVISDALYEVAASYGPEVEAKTVKIPNGVDFDFWTRQRASLSSDGVPTIVSVGRLEKVKGSDVLMRAFAEVAQRVPNARLVMIGDGSLRPELERIAAEHGIVDRVELTGAMDRMAVRDRLHRAHVFAMPSRSEGFGLAALEGMAAGLPVVGSAVGGLPELTGEGGLLVPPEQPDALADALVSVLTDESLHQRTAAAAVQRAEVFSWERSVDAYEAVLEAGSPLIPQPPGTKRRTTSVQHAVSD